MSKWFVYILQCNDKSYYTGITTDIERRTKEHNSGIGAKYTKGRAPVELISYVEVENRSKALKLEAHIKKKPKNKKIESLLKYEDVI